MRRSLRKNVRQLHQDEKLAKMLQGEEEREAARESAAWREVLAVLSLLALLRKRGRPRAREVLSLLALVVQKY